MQLQVVQVLSVSDEEQHPDPRHGSGLRSQQQSQHESQPEPPLPRICAEANGAAGAAVTAALTGAACAAGAATYAVAGAGAPC